MRKSWVAMGLLTMASAPALAAPQQGPVMWGVGGHIGTMVIPSAYPSIWPDGVNADTTSLEKARGDFQLGAEGLYYLDRSSRIGLNLNYGSAKGFSDLSGIATYDFSILDATSDIDIMAGLGAGIGTTHWKSDVNDNETLRVNYFPIRGQLGAMWRFDTWAIQPRLWAQLNIPSNTLYFNKQGNEVEDAGGTFSLLGYTPIGIELTGYWGDFKPPKPHKKGGSGGGGGGGGGNGGGGKNGGKGGGGGGGGNGGGGGGNGGGGKGGGGKGGGGGGGNGGGGGGNGGGGKGGGGKGN